MNLPKPLRTPTEPSYPHSAKTRGRDLAPARLSTHVFRGWTPSLDSALGALHEDEDWPHELYRLLIEAVPRDRTRIVLWLEKDEPVCLVALNGSRNGVWEPVTQWVIPGLIGPAARGRLGECIVRTPLLTRVAWWRVRDPIPTTGPHLRRMVDERTHSLSLSTDFEAYWKQTGLFKKSISVSRRRCAHLQFAVNRPGVAEWVTKKAEEQWRSSGEAPSWELSKHLIVVDYLQRRGKLLTFSLHDADTTVAGEICLVHRGDLVATKTFRNRAYQELGVGNYLCDRYCHWAKEHGFAILDIGGSHAYKARWGPAVGTKAKLLVGPATGFIGYQVRKLAASMRHTVYSRLKRTLGVLPR